MIFSLLITPSIETACVSKRAIWQQSAALFEDRLPIIKQWIQDCELNHSDVCHEKVEHCRPKRLIDLKMLNRPRLLKTRDLPDAKKSELKYTTLSHCWGSVDYQATQKALRSNEAAYHQEIPLANLPLTLREAPSK
jgi:hypothetical protein